MKGPMPNETKTKHTWYESSTGNHQGLDPSWKIIADRIFAGYTDGWLKTAIAD